MTEIVYGESMTAAFLLDLFRIVGKRPHWKSWETRLMVPLSRGSIGRRLGVLDKGPFHLAVIVNPKTEVWYNKQQLGVNEHRPGDEEYHQQYAFGNM